MNFLLLILSLAVLLPAAVSGGCTCELEGEQESDKRRDPSQIQNCRSRSHPCHWRCRRLPPGGGEEGVILSTGFKASTVFPTTGCESGNFVFEGPAACLVSLELASAAPETASRRRTDSDKQQEIHDLI
ncbi:cytosolic chaperonin protein [Striga asiatica]|uniref:Cytosolic chaperonin protein n=1 Tax=Striga asiatica TaxID=4170 RepID=A0A5A7QY70_STRAF|nr:cytosolic chaperonin protein [Striga asiatica]